MDSDKLIAALERDCSQCTRYGKAYNPPCLRCSGFKKNFRWIGGTQDELRVKVTEAFKAQASQLAAAVAAEHRMAKFIILHGLADTHLCDDMRTDFKTVYCTENPHDDSCIQCIIQHFGCGPQEAGEVEHE